MIRKLLLVLAFLVVCAPQQGFAQTTECPRAEFYTTSTFSTPLSSIPLYQESSALSTTGTRENMVLDQFYVAFPVGNDFLSGGQFGVEMRRNGGGWNRVPNQSQKVANGKTYLYAIVSKSFIYSFIDSLEFRAVNGSGNSCGTATPISAQVQPAGCGINTSVCSLENNTYRIGYSVSMTNVIAGRKYSLIEANRARFSFGNLHADFVPTSSTFQASNSFTLPLEAGEHSFCVAFPMVSGSPWNTCSDIVPSCSFSINVDAISVPSCTAVPEIPDTPEAPVVAQPSTEIPELEEFDLCSQIPNQVAKFSCQQCRSQHKGIWTAVGCINTNPTSIVRAIIQIGLGVSGGIALLMILAASFMLAVSKGEPKKTGEARDLLTSAVVGILFIIFSVSILQFIGVSILKIPGFGG